MRRPRILRSSSFGRPTSSRPSSRIEPETIRPGGSTSPISEKPVTLLPEPDSPTSPSTSARASENDTLSTALTTPALVKKWVVKFSTSRMGSVMGNAPPLPLAGRGRGGGRRRRTRSGKEELCMRGSAQPRTARFGPTTPTRLGLRPSPPSPQGGGEYPRPSPPQPRIELVPDLIADEVDRDDEEDEGDARIDRDPVAPAHHVLEAVGDEHAEGGLRRRQAEAEERERRLERDRIGDLHRRDDDQRRQGVRQEVPEHDAPARKRRRGCRFDIILAPLGGGGAEGGAGEIGILRGDERRDELRLALPEERREHEREEDRRKRELEVDNAHDEHLEPPARIGRDDAERAADRERDAAGDKAHLERDAQSVEDR